MLYEVITRSTLLVDDGAGGLMLPEIDPEGDRPDPLHPVLARIRS